MGFSFLPGELLWLLAVVQPIQAVGFCSQAPPQPSQDRGEMSHTDTSQLFGLTAGFNIWIPSREVIKRSKREFRLTGEEIPFGQLIQAVLWGCSRLWHSHWSTLLGDLDVLLIFSPRTDAEGDGPSHPPCRHRAAEI